MHTLNKTIICGLTALAISAYAEQNPKESMDASSGSELGPASIVVPNDPAAGVKQSLAPIELRPQGGRFSFHLRADQRSIIPQVLGAYDILVTLDSSVQSRNVNFDGDDLPFAEAADLVKLATGTFFVPLDSHRALVVADTGENRARFERLVEQNIYLQPTTAAEATEMQNIAHTIFGADHSIAQDSQGRMTIRAPEEEVTAMRDSFADLFQPQSELQLEVRVCEVDRTVGTNTGTVLPNSATLFNVRSEINSVIANNASLVEQIIASGLASAGDYSAILAVLLASGDLTGTVFNSPFVLFGGGLTETGVEWNTTSANMLLDTSDVRTLNQIQLRVMDGAEATFRSGERYPIMTSSYTAVSTSSTSSASTLTVPQVQYQDLGLTLKVRPSIESEKDVSLNIDLRLSSLAGSTINN